MSEQYIALYRKWRPAVFEDVVEQQHIVSTLRHSVQTGRVAHAYLFCGTRGTGKTTMAHIMSRAVNCLSPVNGDPCNECENCKDILSGASTDVIEIDAASNNSVDNVREIRSEVVYAPSKAKFKVYIIDEVHMLSTGAFNALLKTLEEPPPHVKFILATTEPHKLPPTILSRCQRFDFRRITTESIMARLDEIATAGDVSLTRDGARLIAKMADGALRDAISILDQCMGLGNKTVSYEDVLAIVGIVNDTFTTDFAEAILSKNIRQILLSIEALVMDGKDISHFVSDLIVYFRNLLVFKVSDSPGDVLDVHPDLFKALAEQSVKCPQEQLTEIIRELYLLANTLKWAGNPRIMLEAGLVKICCSTKALHAVGVDPSIERRLSQLEKKFSISAQTAAGMVSPDNVGIVSPEASVSEPNQPKKPVKSVPQANSTDADIPYMAKWGDVLEFLKNLGRMTLYTYLIDTKAVVLDGGVLCIVFNKNNSFGKSVVTRHEHASALEDAIRKVTGQEMQLRCVDEESLSPGSATKKKAPPDEMEEKARKMAEQAGVPFEVIDG